MVSVFINTCCTKHGIGKCPRDMISNSLWQQGRRVPEKISIGRKANSRGIIWNVSFVGRLVGIFVHFSLGVDLWSHVPGGKVSSQYYQPQSSVWCQVFLSCLKAKRKLDPNILSCRLLLVPAAAQPTARASWLAAQRQNWNSIRWIYLWISEWLSAWWILKHMFGSANENDMMNFKTYVWIGEWLSRHLLMKRTKLVKKNPIQMQVINGMFWGKDRVKVRHVDRCYHFWKEPTPSSCKFPPLEHRSCYAALIFLHTPCLSPEIKHTKGQSKRQFRK